LAPSRVIKFYKLAQTGGLDPHDRIILRIERFAASKDFDANGVGFESGASTFERLCHCEFQEFARALVSLELGAEQNARKLRFNFAARQVARQPCIPSKTPLAVAPRGCQIASCNLRQAAAMTLINLDYQAPSADGTRGDALALLNEF
jgi:hypothetical protein